MRHNISCLMLALSLGVAGCATTPSPSYGDDDVVLTLTASGSLLLNGKTTELDQLAKRLRSAGATLDTPITIDIAAATPLSSVSAISSRLASAGYRKILFKRPKHATASTQTTRPIEPPTPAPPP